MPCGHAFDVDWISVQLKMLRQPSRQDPFCRTKSDEVRYDFTPEGGYSTHMPGRGDQLSDPFLRDDEIVRPGASEVERRRRTELRRLRALEDYNPSPWELQWMEIVAQEGGTTIFTRRSLRLNLTQERRILTHCLLIRKLSLVTFQDFSFPLADPSDFHPKEVAKAREEIKRCPETLGGMRAFWKLAIHEPEDGVRFDKRGLYSLVVQTLAVSRVLGKEDITIEETLTMGEKFLIELPK
jgi:hypothetical protein